VKELLKFVALMGSAAWCCYYALDKGNPPRDLSMMAGTFFGMAAVWNWMDDRASRKESK
jgi:hypothetical protein